jgi:hypothetical protein
MSWNLKKNLIRELKMENLKRTTMKETFTNHNGCLPKGERVIVISVIEQKHEVKVADPFDREWIVPLSSVNLD